MSRLGSKKKMFLMNIGSSTPNVTTLKNNLLAVIDFEETSGYICYDSHNSYDFTSVENIVSDTGILGNAKKFSPSIPYTHVTNTDLDSVISIGNVVTFSVWVKTTNGSGTSYIFAYGHNEYTDDKFALLRSASDIYLRSKGNDSLETLSVGTSGDLVNGEWHHIACTIDRSVTGVVQSCIFYDGVKYEGDVIYNSSNFASSVVSYIGGKDNYTPFTFDGSIDQFSIWNRTLTDTEIIDGLYNSGNGFDYINW